MSEEGEGQPFQGEISKPHYRAAEVSSILKNRVREQGNALTLNQETVEKENVEARPENFAVWADKVREEMRIQQQKHEWWLQEVVKNPEEAEQYKQLWENAEKLRDNLSKFSEDDPNIPASDETKRKLEQLGQIADADRDMTKWEVMSTHERSTFLFLTLVGIGGILEAFDYITGGGYPGIGAKTGLIMGTAFASSVEGYSLAKNGVEKLRALIRKNKGSRAGGPQPSQAETGENKT